MAEVTQSLTLGQEHSFGWWQMQGFGKTLKDAQACPRCVSHP